MRTYTAKRDYVVVELEGPEEVSPGGIALLAPAEEPRQSFGKVIAVGPGDWDKKGKRIPMSVKVGDRVAFSQYGHHTPEKGVRVFREPSVHYVCES